MNIFYLDRDPKIAAQMMCDKHVIKMIVESAQMLSTVHRVLSGPEYSNREGLYKSTHKNHPSTKWVADSDQHYFWLYNHMVELMREYSYRYNKKHATSRLLNPLASAPESISSNGFIDPPQCMPDYCTHSDTPTAYQTYYLKEKAHMATWKTRKIPDFWNPAAQIQE